MHQPTQVSRGWTAVCLLLPLLSLLSAPAHAQLAAHAPPAAAAASSLPTGWVTHVEAHHGFAIALPPGHEVGPSGQTWYVYAELDGAPLTPDLSLTFVPGANATERFTGAVVTPVESVSGTTLFKVESTFQDTTGASQATYRYLAQGPGGVMILARWEDFDWPPFDEVASRFQFVVVIPRPE